MDWKAKVDLFEQLRREHEFGVGTIAGVAAKFGVHRRMVRQALANALPPPRQYRQRAKPKLDAVLAFIDGVLEEDRRAPRKQRHTARRLHRRLLTAFPGVVVAESTVRNHVRERKRAMGLVLRETFVPQSYALGQEAQVDWYEAWVDLGGDRTKVQVFAMRSMASGAAFHRGYLHATQQAFLEAHEAAFDYFGGVFRLLRYDNLTSAVRKILRGHRREETVRFVAFRSHWRFAAEFCTPGEGHEKGGIEGEVGYFRRNHLVPVPVVTDLDALNALLLAGCRADEARVLDGRREAVSAVMAMEREHLLRPAAEGFNLADVVFPVVDKLGCVTVKTNAYSVPAPAGSRVEARVHPLHVEIWQGGRRVARHERCHGRRQQVLDLEHYLDVLGHKPGALAGSRPLEQWRQAGRWLACHDELWARLQARHGKQDGTRAMVAVLMLGREFGEERLRVAIATAVSLGACDVAAVRYLLAEAGLHKTAPAAVDVGALARYDRPMPSVADYDMLLHSSPCAGTA
ncbi:IS21 family transposase [Paracraurococcus lichenis]|uniref:IS21 family transposase n=1 Tax=Paracraurococcus lichenis TaxID=3064888 RepID=A0ABT9EA52_9PROT|nr:IS21 family transposase [Paracraurococcus sp. LOR1-02]MDO9713076.1 IS21 family transposase [Paracraurococcus sp. LOR1-02]